MLETHYFLNAVFEVEGRSLVKMSSSRSKKCDNSDVLIHMDK